MSYDKSAGRTATSEDLDGSKGCFWMASKVKGSLDHQQRVKRHFSECAPFYLDSEIHARGSSLNKLLDFVRPKQYHAVLDVATGAGHTAIRLAPHVQKVICVDISPAMLEVAKVLSEKKHLFNIRFCEGNAENLDFPSGMFDVVSCRLAPHHFPNPGNFLAEANRVLKRDGKLIIVDTYVPEDAEADVLINQIQTLRDNTHVRSLRMAEWRELLLATHFDIIKIETCVLEGNGTFDEWVSISKTPQKNVTALENLISATTDSVRKHLNIEIREDCMTLQIPEMIVLSRKMDNSD